MTHLATAPPHPLPSALRRGAGLAPAILGAAFTYVFLANAWLGDDAYITFRVVWNTLHGYGVVFNPGERVQAYTHPLWLIVLTAAHAVTREFFFTALFVCYGFSLAAIVVVLRRARDIVVGAVAVAWLLSSKAFVDYTSSGLENPLSYLLLAIFYTRFFAAAGHAASARALAGFGVIAGLAFVNRMDTVLLYALPLARLAVDARHDVRGRLVPLVAGFLVPVAAWTVFATVYYGFPLPNTYYAKVATGIPSSLMYRQGLAYVLNSFAHDPITLGTIGIAAALAVRASTAVRLAAASALSYVVYTVSVGGDFMSGRFFTLPFLAAAMTVLHAAGGLMTSPVTSAGMPVDEGTPSTRWAPLAAAAGLLAYNIVMPLVPVKTTANYDAGWPWRSQNGIKDERGHYHRITNVFFYSPFRELPDHTWMREGRSFSQSPEKVTVQGSIGFYGLMAGPEKHIVDRNALSDPLLARLPVSLQLYFEFYAGHYFRDIPDGYLESIRAGENRVADPVLHEYYGRLRNVITGPLLSASRWRDMWYLNAGAGRTFARRYAADRPVTLSVRAANERFSTDVGERDMPRGTMRSTGRAGYLQYGPGIPMKAGRYVARWIGTVETAPGAIGFVDVWTGDRRIARREITVNDVLPGERRIAEIPFVLDGPVGALEYRLWVREGPALVLERVELWSR